MAIVRNILKEKGSQIHSVKPDCIVFDALAIMHDKNISALLVIENDKLLGIFSERDYARKVVLKGKASREIQIGEVMTTDLITVTPDSTIEDCMRLMTHQFIRYLPVMEGDKLVGFITMGDVVKNIIEEQKVIIEHLEHYITH